MNRYTLFLCLLFGLAQSCNLQKEGVAPDINFYYEIEFPASNHTAKFHADYLAERIPLYKYAITNSSGYDWPFYQEFNINYAVMSDSLMPPHWYTHKMIPGKAKKIKEGEFYVAIELYSQPDTLPNYNVTIYKMKSDSLQLSATTGIHYIQPSQYKNDTTLSKLLLESILRYSFK